MASTAWKVRNRLHLQAYERHRYGQRIQHREEVAEWKRAHPEAKQRENRVRIQRQGGSGRNFDRATRQRVWMRQMGECGLCGAGMNRMEIDHIEPLVLGGPHAEWNIHLVHPECNRAKGQKRLTEVG